MKTLSTLGTVLAIVALLASSASAQNLILNPGFEDNGGSYDGYFTFGEAPQISDVSTDNIFRSGAAASKIFNFSLGCPFPPNPPGVNGYGQGFTSVQAGKLYEFSGYSYVSSADPLLGAILCESNRTIAKLVFFNAAVGGSEISATEIVIGDSKIATDAWVPFSISLVAPASALRVEIVIVHILPTCDGGATFIDDLSLTVSDPPVPPNPNLLANPDFSSGVAVGWIPFGNAIDEPNGTWHRSAGGAAALFGTFVEGDDSGLNQFIPVTPGTTYELSAWTMSHCNAASITGQNANLVLGIIQFRDGSDLPIGGPVAQVFLDNTNPLGTYTQGSVRATAPAGAASAEVLILFEQPNVEEGGSAFIDDAFFGVADPTDAPSANLGFVLEQNNPNPFNPKTTIRFALDRQGDVSLRVFDTKGRLVTTLADRGFEAGPHALTWDGRSDDGRALGSGIYHYVLETANGREARSMVLLK